MSRLAVAKVFIAVSIIGWNASSLPAQESSDFALTIIHTNDVHSRYEFIDRDAAPCSPSDSTESSCFLPAARLATAIQEARSRNRNIILLDAGDQFPTPRFPVPPEIGRPLAAELMNRMRYDAMTLGNHEFDDGPEILASFIDDLTFPVLTADDGIISDTLLADRVSSTAVLEVAGSRVGLIGLGAASGTFDRAPEVVAQKLANDLMAQDVNKIVLISHFGYDTDKRIAEATKGVDVIVGGHSHTRLSNSSMGKKLGMTYPTMVNGVAIVQAYAYGTYLGELHVTFDALGNLIGANGDPIPMDKVEDDVEVKARVEEIVSKIPALETP